MKYVILGKAGCSYCLRAKKLCKDKGINFTYISLTNELAALLESLFNIEIKTVPVVLFDTGFYAEHVGGFEELKLHIEEGCYL